MAGGIPTPAVHNQIFAASRFPFTVGDLQPPQFDGSAISNFLHLKFDDFPVEMVGKRAPVYSKAADKHAYWAELAGIMESAKNRKILFAGDVNYDPFKKAKQPNAKTVPFHLCDGYVIPNPRGDWSYLAYSGNGFKIDHVMHTSAVEVTQVEYLDWIRGRFLAGEKIKKPVSDHAVLRFRRRGSVLEFRIHRSRNLFRLDLEFQSFPGRDDGRMRGSGFLH